MPGSRIPGPLCSNGRPTVIDNGTLCRHASPTPTTIGASLANPAAALVPATLADWPLRKKFQYVAANVSANLPEQLQLEFVRLVPRYDLSTKLEAAANSRLINISTPKEDEDQALFKKQVFGELSSLSLRTALAKTEPDLDAAAMYLAKSIETAGVSEWAGVLAHFEVGRGGAGGGESKIWDTSPPEKSPKRSASSKPSRSRQPPLKFDDPTTWIEIQVVDQDDHAVSKAKYKLVLTDGSTREGTLGSDGKILVYPIPPGTCDFMLLEMINCGVLDLQVDRSWDWQSSQGSSSELGKNSQFKAGGSENLIPPDDSEADEEN